MVIRISNNNYFLAKKTIFHTFYKTCMVATNVRIKVNKVKSNETVLMSLCIVMCLSIGTHKNNKFSICFKCKINYFRCPKIWAHYSLLIMYSKLGHLKIINFPFGTNGKSMVLCAPIFKHFRISCSAQRMKMSSQGSYKSVLGQIVCLIDDWKLFKDSKISIN